MRRLFRNKKGQKQAAGDTFTGTRKIKKRLHKSDYPSQFKTASCYQFC